MNRRTVAALAACTALFAAAASSLGRADATFTARSVNPGNSLVASATYPTYPQAVAAGGPSRYVRMADAAGGGVLADNLTATGLGYLDTGYSFDRTGNTADGNHAVLFNGGSSLGAGGWGPSAATVSTVADPQTFTLECWFSTTGTRGGELFGFGDQRKAVSFTYDRVRT